MKYMDAVKLWAAADNTLPDMDGMPENLVANLLSDYIKWGPKPVETSRMVRIIRLLQHETPNPELAALGNAWVASVPVMNSLDTIRHIQNNISSAPDSERCFLAMSFFVSGEDYLLDWNDYVASMSPTTTIVSFWVTSTLPSLTLTACPLTVPRTLPRRCRR